MEESGKGIGVDAVTNDNLVELLPLELPLDQAWQIYVQRVRRFFVWLTCGLFGLSVLMFLYLIIRQGGVLSIATALSWCALLTLATTKVVNLIQLLLYDFHHDQEIKSRIPYIPGNDSGRSSLDHSDYSYPAASYSPPGRSKGCICFIILIWVTATLTLLWIAENPDFQRRLLESVMQLEP
jgi:hypothetical protein